MILLWRTVKSVYIISLESVLDLHIPVCSFFTYSACSFNAHRTYSSRKVETVSGLVPAPLQTSFLEMTRRRFSHTLLILILSTQVLIKMKIVSQRLCLSVLSLVIQQQTSVTTWTRELLYFPRMFTRTETWRPWKKKIRNGRSVAIQHTSMTRPMSGIGMSGKETRDNSCSVSIFPKTKAVCGSLATIILTVPSRELNMYVSLFLLVLLFLTVSSIYMIS